MSTTQKVKIIIRNGTTNYTGTLGAGELFYNSSGKKLYIGDGSTAIASLPYFVHFSQTDKNKLDGIATGATKVTESTVSNWGFTKNTGTVTSVKLGSQSYTPSSGVISLPAYPNIVNASNSGTVPSIGTTSTWSTSGNYRFLVSTYSSNTWNEPTWITIGDATSSQRGLMTAAQAEKLNGIAAGANNYSHPATHSASMITGLATVATSGAYSDLSGAPTKVGDLTNDAGYTTATGHTHSQYNTNEDVINHINDKAVLYDGAQSLTNAQKTQARTNIGAGTSSFSGSYNDLTNKPTIPTVNNATLTIKKNGTTVNTFTANASSNVTANITVPTKVSDLTDANNYALKSDLVGVFEFKGSLTSISNLPTSVEPGAVYNISSSFTADSKFPKDSGNTFPAGTNVVYVADDNGNYWEVLGGTYSEATTSVSGLMSSGDKRKLNEIEAGANLYSLPLAANGTRGGIQVGYITSGAKIPLQLSSEKAYVELTNTSVTSALGYTPPTTNTTYNIVNSGNNGLAPKVSTTEDWSSSGTYRILTSTYSSSAWNEPKWISFPILPANTAITGATKCKITYDSKGLVTSGADLAARDIPNLAASKIISGTFDVARIPGLAASKITSGTFNIARIPTGTSSTTVSKGDHTHNYAGSSSAGGAATSANKVNAAITFNNGGSGVASGTTFNGFTARTVSYNTIGAAPSSHTHNYAASSSAGGPANAIDYTNVISSSGFPASANTSGLKIIVSSLTPSARYAGYLYITI